jgi:hypothetical protein
MIAPNHYLLHYFLREYHFWFTLFSFTRTFSGTQFGRKTRAGCTPSETSTVPQISFLHTEEVTPTFRHTDKYKSSLQNFIYGFVQLSHKPFHVIEWNSKWETSESRQSIAIFDQITRTCLHQAIHRLFPVAHHPSINWVVIQYGSVSMICISLFPYYSKLDTLQRTPLLSLCITTSGTLCNHVSNLTF